MANTTATFNFYDHVSERAGDGGIDWDNDAFEMILTTVTHVPASTDTVLADIDNEVVGNGYARQALSGVTWSRSGDTTTFDNPVFTASGGSITARNWHIRDTTNNLLIAWGLLDNTPGDVVTTDTNTLTAEVNAAGFFDFAPV